MTGYTKLFGRIIHSTVWSETSDVRIVWVSLLAMADRDGVVHASIPGLAQAARVSLEICEEALRKFQAPDKYSSTRDHDGRRIAEVAGGWLLLNHAKYRETLSAEDRKEKAAVRQARYRANHPRRVPDPDPKADPKAESEAVHVVTRVTERYAGVTDSSPRPLG